MDGVIIDSEPLHLKMEAQLFKKLGINVSLDEHSSYVGRSSRNMWELILRKNNLLMDIDGLVKEKNKLYLDYLRSSKDLRAIAGIPELLLELSRNNFKLVLASSSTLEVIKSILEILDLTHFFPFQLSGDDLLYSKPNPGIFMKSAELAQSHPWECVVFEDSKNGVIAAKLAKMKCIGYLNPNSGKQNLEEADLVIKSFNSINVNIIRNM
jgi:HAD superfamily hydrolase (TIGR01509 family)